MEVRSQSFDDLIEIARTGRDRSVWTDVVKKAIVQGDHAKQAVAERQLEALPDVLDVLRANSELADRLVGTRWIDVRLARESGHSWEVIAEALSTGVKDLIADYAASIGRQERYVPTHDAERSRTVLDP